MHLGIHSIFQHIIMYISTHLHIHISPRIIFMYISTHLYIYLHASYSHIHVTKPRTCNNTTNMYQCCRYVTILRICNNTTNTYIYRCYNNSIYNTTSLPYLQRWIRIPEHTYYTKQQWNINIYPQCPLMYIQMLHPYTIHPRNCMCEVMQLFMAFKLLYIFRSVNTTRYTYSHNSHR